VILKRSTSIWPPVLDNLKTEIQQDEELVIAFSPFIRSEALKVFLDNFGSKVSKVIVRWRVEDLLAGVSDLKIFDLLKEREIVLYQSSDIHLKLFQFSSNRAYIGSANITNKGLSLCDNYNEEAGVIITLEMRDFQEIRRLCDESRLVTSEIVEAYRVALEASEKIKPNIVQPELPVIDRTKYLVSYLPATETPEEFLDQARKGKFTAEGMHDLYTLKLQNAISTSNFEEQAREAFRNLDYVQEIVKFIKEAEPRNKGETSSRSFGAITAFIHNICEDVPLPYRSKIKDFTTKTYNWLAYCFDEIFWDIPGARSQVIYYKR